MPLTGGALLSFARAIGEFGAIIIVAGNIPLYSQTAAVYVWGEVESENRLGASAVSVALLAIAFRSDHGGRRDSSAASRRGLNDAARLFLGILSSARRGLLRQ